MPYCLKRPPLLLLLLLLLTGHRQPPGWNRSVEKGYVLLYTAADRPDLGYYRKTVGSGRKAVSRFFDSAFRKPFGVYVHPSRASLDSTWRREWGDTSFRSECWMVASGVAHRLDLLARRRWKDEACEHRAEDRPATQQVITHELVHVYHGQRNPSGDFSAVTGLDWLVEGMATYASGQWDSTRRGQVGRLVASGRAPESLDGFWKGRERYALAGSVVAWLDARYGRSLLRRLLACTTRAEALRLTGLDEPQLIGQWRLWILTRP
ncbi:hypothetical protein EPD60_13335 [Flaviaesturariibacter flavus]|uniref:Secretory protein n=1 Tax=Flaviaesturariibacter flavus TaxID=2502780 RepID=A0A4V2NVG2_9BACT|nr:hypothetical protein [Flaviaesturariibacter flavus]TCJ13366.1 hypothetical protein EPD60_13335 [Flaviaesturariibacter flavus]